MCFKVVFVSLIAIVKAECIDFFANQQNDDMFNPSQAKRDLGPRQFSLKSDWQLTAIFRFHGHHHAGHWQPHWSMLLHSMSSKFGKCGDRIPAIWFYHSKNKDENKLHVASCVATRGSVSLVGKELTTKLNQAKLKKCSVQVAKRILTCRKV